MICLLVNTSVTILSHLDHKTTWNDRSRRPGVIIIALANNIAGGGGGSKGGRGKNESIIHDAGRVTTGRPIG